MSTRAHKGLSGVLIVLLVIASCSIWGLAWRLTYGAWDAQDASLASRHIEKMRQHALDANPKESALCLQEILAERAHWNWQRPDLHFGDLIETQRFVAVQEIIEHLKSKTGEDLGKNPEKWIEKYGK